MSMRKIFRTIVLTLSFAVGMMSIPLATFAAENNTENIIQEDAIISEKFVDSNLVGSSLDKSTSNGMVRANNYGERQVTSANYTTRKTVYVTPTGQPGLGYRRNPNAKIGVNVIFFSTGGSSTKFTVTVNYKAVTFTAETGRTTTKGNGYGDLVPAKAGNYRFQFIKYYTIKLKKIDVYNKIPINIRTILIIHNIH